MNRESNRRQKEKPQQTIKRQNTKKEKKRGLHVGGGYIPRAKHSHETKGTCPGVLRVGENRVRRKMKLVG